MLRPILAVAASAVLTLGLIGPASAEVYDGTEDRDRLIGGKQNDLLYGRGGNDFLKGNGGQDAHRAGDGHDKIKVGDGRERGFNDAVGGAGADEMWGGQGYTYAEGSAGLDHFFGATTKPEKTWFQQDYFRGNGGPDWGELGPGRDTFEPDEGADVGHLGAGGDYVFIWPDGEVDKVFCGEGKDLVEYFGDIDPLDKLRKCEEVLDPDKSDGKSDTRAEVERRLAR